MGTTKNENEHSDAAPAKREPYEAPAIVYREPLEAVAATCTPPPAKATQGSCPGGVLSS